MANVKIEIEIKISDIDNLLINGVEQAIGYWCRNWEGPYTMAELKITDATVTEHDEDTNKYTDHQINYDRVILGLKQFAKNEPKHFADMLAENDDGETADVFIQTCLFGKSVYG